MSCFQDGGVYCTATVAVNGEFNHELEPQVNISIQAMDRGGLQVTANMSIHVVDVNDPPTDILINGEATTNISVPENANYFTIGKLEALDEDVNDGHAFFLTNSAGRKFIIEDDILKTYAAANLDYEETRNFQIRILVEDLGTPKLLYQKTFNVYVEDVNEAPSTLSLSKNMVIENSGAGTEVGRLSTSDPDNDLEATQTFTYSLKENSKGRFAVDGDIIKVSRSIDQCKTATCRLDFESEPYVSIEVNVTDSGSPHLSITHEFKIQVVDANDAPHTISLPDNTVRENSPVGAFIGTLTSVEEDAGQSVSYMLLDNKDLFELKSGSRLISKGVYDYEEVSSYNITVRATDNGKDPLSVDTTMTIEVLNINEAPKFSGDVEFQVNENAAIYTLVGVLSVSDPDREDHLTFTITGAGSVFKVTDADCQQQEVIQKTLCTCNLVLNEPLDYANWPEFTITVTAQDQGGLTVTQDLVVKVLDANNPPTNILINGHSTTEIPVKENQKDTSIATLEAVDSDQGQIFTYSIVFTDTELFEIIEDQLKVVAGANLDYESTEEYTIEISVTDDGTPPQNFTKVVSILIQDVNEPPSNLSITSTQIVENSGEGVVVGEFLVEDPDNAKLPKQSATFTLVDNADGRFMIKGNELQVAKPNGVCLQLGGDKCYLNFESAPVLHISVLVTDTGVPSRSDQFEMDINVVDENDPPRNIQISNYKIEALASAGEVVGKLTADDEDDKQSMVYSLLDDNNGLFAVSESGVVTKATDDELDINTLYAITASATDNGTIRMQSEETFTIVAIVKDITKMTLNITSEGSGGHFDKGWPVVSENLPDDTVVGTLVATDQRPDQTLVIQIISQLMALKLDTTTNCMNKDGGTECKVKVLTGVELDFESTPIVVITGQVTDGHNQSFTHQFILHVQNVNEPPEGLRFDGDRMFVQENLNGEVFELFIAQDPDENDVLSYSLVDDGDGRFTITKDGHLATARDANIDFEVTPWVNITVNVRDAAGLGLQTVYTVDISDVNENPGSITLTNNTVEEMSPPGTHVGILEAVDSDQGQTIAYKLLSDADGRFWVDDNVIKVKDEGILCTEKGGAYCLLDYESEISHTIMVEASDNGSPVLRTTTVIHVLVKDVNDQPRDLTFNLVNVREDNEIGEVIGKLTAFDDDAGASLHYTILSGDDSEVFLVNGSDVLLQKHLDYETTPKYSLTLEAIDNGQPPQSISSVFELNIVDANEPPGVPTFIPKTSGNHDFPVNAPVVDENAVLNTLIGQIVVKDPDDNDMVMFTTTNLDIGFFYQECWPLKQGVHCSCDVRALVSFDYETQPSVDVSVSVTDRKGLTSLLTVTLDIADVNDPPTDILMNNQSLTTLSVAENSESVILTSMTAVDVDAEDSHTFSILTRTNAFFVVGDSIKVSPQGIDYELYPTHDIVIRVTDSGNPPLYLDKHVTVNVIDVNEAPDHIFLSKNEVPEDSPVGFEIGTVIVDDPDNTRSTTQTFTYSLKDSADDRFRLDGASLTVARSDFDYERKRMYILHVLVTDTGIPPLSTKAAVTVYVTDANDSPKDVQLIGGVVPENSAMGTVVGSFLATDDDFDQQITYSLLSNDFFTVAGDELMVDGELDYESSPTIALGVIASDDGLPPMSISMNVTVTIVDVNEAPVNITLQTSDKAPGMMIPESLGPGELIGFIHVTDPDLNDRITLKQIGDMAAMFKVSQNPQCKNTPMLNHHTECRFDLILAQSVDFEGNNSNITVEIEASDVSGETLNTTWKFGIKNSNEPPSNIFIDGDIKIIPENSPEFLIGSLNSEDEDEGDEFVYHILTHWEIFRITNNRLVAKPPLDYEVDRSVTVSIRCTDSGSPPLTFTKEFIFDVGDKNEEPTNIVLSHTEVSNTASPGDVVGFITVKDPDNQGSDTPVQVHTCTAGGDALGFFSTELSAPLTLKVTKAIPKDIFEMLLLLTCKDNGNPVLSLTVNVTLTIHETVDIQKNLRLRNQRTIPENSDAYFVVGDLEVVNMLTEEVIGGTYTYALSNDQHPFITNGPSLQTSISLDFEQQAEWEINVVASGVDIQNKDVNISETFVIEVGDINEAPYKINIYGGGLILENSEPGTEIGDLNSEDPDEDQTYSYTIISVSSGLDMSEARQELTDTFSLRGKTLIVGRNSEQLNYEVVKYFTVLIQTTDSGNTPLSYNDTIHIQVEDTNDVPTGILLSKQTVKENSIVGTVVGKLDLIDEDVSSSYTCVVINLQSVPFKVVNDSILVTSKAELDYEGSRVFAVEIQCTDEGIDETHLTIIKTIVVNVTNINEPPIRIEMTNTDIVENNQEGQVIGEIKTTDPDSNKVKITLVNGDESSVFSVEGDSTIVASKALNFEEQAEYEITVRATDDKGLWSEETFQIEVQDKNEPPSSVVLDSESVNENTGPGYTIGTLTTLDDDHGQNFHYVIVDDQAQATQDYFQIKNDKLVTGGKPLDHEMLSEYTIGIKSTDNGVPPYSVQTKIKIKVDNINEEPEDIIVDAMLSLPENTNIPAVVTSVDVDDPDVGQNHICQVEPASLPFIIKTYADHRMELVLNGALDYETKEEYDVVLRCSDGFLERKKSIPVLVSDVNERPEEIHLSGSGSIVASAQPGVVVGTFSVQDPDPNQTHTLTMTGPNSDLFQIEGYEITLTSSLPDEIVYAEHPVITINVTATDNGMPKPLSVQQIFTLVVTDVQVVVQQLPVITLRKVDLLEDSKPGKIIGSLLKANVSTEDIEFNIILNPFGAFKISKNKSLILNQTLTDVDGDSMKLTVEVKNKETFKSAATDIMIFIVRVDKCARRGNETCDEHGRCVQQNDASYNCECETGYTGDGFYCTLDTNCDANPCTNGGRCVDGIAAATCLCKDGYSGPLCEVDNNKNNPCFKSPCKHGGICSLNHKLSTGYECECEPGWKGSTCEESINDCIDFLCYGGGQCVDKHMTYVCKCPEARNGIRCEYFRSSCATVSCGSEICVPMVDKDEKICASKTSNLVHLQVKKSQGKFDEEEFSAWLIDTITAFYRRSASGSNNKPRVKRQIVNETPVQVYIADVQEEATADLVKVDFVVLDSSEKVYEKNEILGILSNTCDELRKDQNDETVLCPAVSRATGSDQVEDVDETGPPVAAIAGAVAGVAVLVGVAVVAFIIYRKRKQNGDNSYKDTLR
ncbi:protocadherin Fat 4-like [Ylistrum balloti]|uniref:protocadherin Fat 4-like n=1 Tax=Ylistrum balloti TaxID=509963 RepID=UPI002905D362|nr:protocadherin Fat 4-like [Ylistrum balloti]